MSAVTSVSLCWTLLSVCLLFVSAGQEITLAQTGQAIILTCKAPSNNNSIIAVEWSRADLEPEYVLLYRDNKLVPDYQHPSFKNRVDLNDRQMKDGDVSLILMDLTTDDVGAYECYVVQKGANHSKTTSLDSYYIRTTYLTVSLRNQNNNIVMSGGTATLECQAPNRNDPIIAAVWIRADLEPEYVLFYWDDEIDPDDQHPSFKNRVDLQDRQMKDGDVSVILKDVTADDSGVYLCYVDQRRTNRRKRASLDIHPIRITYLTVVPPNQKNITVESGQNIILPCRVTLTDLRPIMVVVWKRADLGEEYVLSYQNQQFHPENQHPSFKNRVDLQDRQMKDGDVSLILKDATTDDSGAYECYVVQRELFGRETASPHSERISTTYLSVVRPHKKIIIAVMGQMVTLPCRALNSNNPIIAAEWSRADLEPKHVLFYQDYKLFPDYQHPSFKNRVDLQDRQMKDGDVSLILKNVTINDTGTYECYVAQRGVNRRKRASLDSYPISTTYLTVLLRSQKTITAESGQDVTLTCQAPNTILIPGVEWSRQDLKAQYVLWYWEKRFVPYYQHPSFKNRVDLQDRQMKDGDVSLILKDVTTADSGTYECCIIQEVRDVRKLDILKTDPISIIHLKVIPPGQPGGHGEDGAVGLTVIIVLSLVSFASIIYYIKMTQKTDGEKNSTAQLQPSTKLKPSLGLTHPTFRGKKTDPPKTDVSSQ